jgi:DNA-binding transcriptional LysR family regulator
MTLEQLRIFVAVARCEHVSQAARDLNLTQSAVSGALQALETRHSVRLLDRIGRGVRLNAAGRAFLPEAEAVLTRAEAAKTALDDISDLRRGRLQICATPTINNYWLPQRLAAFRDAHPGVELAVDTCDTGSVFRAVIEGDAELGLSGIAPDEPFLTATEVGQDQLILVAPAGHPWGRGRRLTAADFAVETWIMRERGSGARDSLDLGLRSFGAELEALSISLTLPSDEAVLGAVEAGAGVSALPECIVLPALRSNRLVRGSLALPSRSFFLVRRRGGYLTRAAIAFTAQLGG